MLGPRQPGLGDTGRLSPPGATGSPPGGRRPRPRPAGNLSRAGFRDATIREIVFTSAGGVRVRVRLTNAFGGAPLRIGRATIALAGSGPKIVGGTSRALYFGGRRSVVIPPGAEAIERAGDAHGARAHRPRDQPVPAGRDRPRHPARRRPADQLRRAPAPTPPAPRRAFTDADAILVLPRRRRRARSPAGARHGRRARRLDHRRGRLPARTQRAVAERPRPAPGPRAGADAGRRRRGDRRQPRAERLAVLRRQRDRPVRARRAATVRRPGRDPARRGSTTSATARATVR